MNRPIDPAVTESVVSHYIGGQRHAGSGTRSADVFNPATGAVSAQVLLGGSAEVEAAVAAARAVAPAWAETSPLKRSRILFKFKELLDLNQDALAAAITREQMLRAFARASEDHVGVDAGLLASFIGTDQPGRQLSAQIHALLAKARDEGRRSETGEPTVYLVSLMLRAAGDRAFTLTKEGPVSEPMARFLRASTFAALSREIRGSASDAEPSSIVPMQPAGSAPPRPEEPPLPHPTRHDERLAKSVRSALSPICPFPPTPPQRPQLFRLFLLHTSQSQGARKPEFYDRLTMIAQLLRQG